MESEALPTCRKVESNWLYSKWKTGAAISLRLIRDKAQHQKIIGDFLYSKQEVLFAYIFGSFVRSDHYHGIDVAVYLERSLNFEDAVKYPYGYESLMMGKLSRLTRVNIDFVIMNKAEIVLSQRIVNGSILLFSKDDRTRIQYEHYVRCLYIDTEHLRGIQRYYLRKHINDA